MQLAVVMKLALRDGVGVQHQRDQTDQRENDKACLVVHAHDALPLSGNGGQIVCHKPTTLLYGVNLKIKLNIIN